MRPCAGLQMKTSDLYLISVPSAGLFLDVDMSCETNPSPFHSRTLNQMLDLVPDLVPTLTANVMPNLMPNLMPDLFPEGRGRKSLED